MDLTITKKVSPVIELQLSKILDSSLFRKSKVLSSFLQYIVSETLDGNGQTLKEYVIAISALNKNVDFDPQLNGVVRIHANRLRKLLDEYYQSEGINDPIIISIPKGRYIPSFKKNIEPNQELTDTAVLAIKKIESKPVVAVLPFENVQNNKTIDIISSVMCHDLNVELTKFSEIGVVTPYYDHDRSEYKNNIREMVADLGVDYLITGYFISEGNRIKISIELTACDGHKIIWAESFYLENVESDTFGNYKRIIQKIIARTCGFFGLIYRNTLNAHVPTSYDCLYAIYWHNRYHLQFSEEAFNETLAAVEIGLEKSPQSALLISFKAELYLNLVVMKTEGDINFLKYGTQLVKKAISYDGTCQHAYQVYAWSNLLNHDHIEIYRTIEKCLAVNPNNPMYIGEMGFGYICAGDYEKGMALMSESVHLNPFYPWNLNFGFCFYFMQAKDYEEALLWAEKVNRKEFLWDPMIRASLLGWLGKKEEAADAIKELLLLAPDFSQKASDLVNAYLLDKNLTKNILDGLLLAGLKI